LNRGDERTNALGEMLADLLSIDGLASATPR
jgi:hypothetical protein